MQLTIPHVELKQAVAGLTRVVPKRATLPVLQMVRFAHEGGRITVAGTDLDQNLAYRFAQATAQGEGAFLVGLADLQLLAKGAEGDVGLKAVSATDIEISHTLGGQPVSRRITTEDPKEWPLPAPKIDAGPVDPRRPRHDHARSAAAGLPAAGTRVNPRRARPAAARRETPPAPASCPCRRTAGWSWRR